MLKKLSYKAQRRVIILAFSLVPVLLLFTFAYLPVFNMFKYSFTNWNGYSKSFDYVGFSNYKTIFTDPKYFSVFKVSLYYFAGTFVQMGLALYFATILSFKVRAKNFFKGVLFFPYLLNGVAIGFIFLFFFKGDGTLDTILNALGLGGLIQGWLLNPNIINISQSRLSARIFTKLPILMVLISGTSSDILSSRVLNASYNLTSFLL